MDVVGVTHKGEVASFGAEGVGGSGAEEFFAVNGERFVAMGANEGRFILSFFGNDVKFLEFFPDSDSGDAGEVSEVSAGITAVGVKLFKFGIRDRDSVHCILPQA